MTVQTDQESFGFQAEAAQILDLMVHSLYSNKEIFLRELISNASDAIDRLRFETYTQPGLDEEGDEDQGPLQIRVSYDKDLGTITVADNGIGMNRAEVIEHIGTIAESGTREFLQALTNERASTHARRAGRGSSGLRGPAERPAGNACREQRLSRRVIDANRSS